MDSGIAQQDKVAKGKSTISLKMDRHSNQRFDGHLG